MTKRAKFRWFKVIASPRLAAVLIVLLIAVALGGVLIPQRTLLTPEMMAEFRTDSPVLAEVLARLGLDALLSGWPIVVLAVALAMNTFACTWERMNRHLHRRDLPKWFDGEAPSAFPDGLRETYAILRDDGWHVGRSADSVLAHRGRSGFWGSVLLHFSLLVIMVGGAFTVLSDFSGTMVLSEGQTVVDGRDAYAAVEKMPEVGEAFTGAQLGLDGMHFEYDDGVLVSAVADMSGVDLQGRPTASSAKVNYPFELAGKSYLLLDSGYCAEIRLKTPDGEYPLVVNLGIETPYGWGDELPLESFGAAGVARSLSLLASPVPLEPGQELPEEKYVPADPRLGLRLVTDEGIGDITVLGVDETAAMSPEVAVTFDGLGYWSRFLVRRDSSRWVVYTGFWLCIAGILWRFFVPERRILVHAGSSGEGPEMRYRVRPWKGFVVPGDRKTIERIERLRDSVQEGADDR